MPIPGRSFTVVVVLAIGTVTTGCQSESSSTPPAGPSTVSASNTAAEVAVGNTAGKPKSRTFELDYGVTVNDVPAGSRLRVWLPMPQTTAAQQISRLRQVVPVEPKQTTESKYGNRMLHFDLKPSSTDPITFQVTWQITRNEVLGLDTVDPAAELDDAERKIYLAANLKVPIDGKPLTLIDPNRLSSKNSIELGRSLYEQVDTHMRYDKSKPGFGNGDVLWACDSGFGNCTDFHSLFISWARSQDLPARFEIGFPLPSERGEGKIGGYHCWAQFHVEGHGWVPTDISEADKHPDLKSYYFGNLTENRVQFTIGRDITLEPAQDSDPLNYFIYPYIEVDGKAWTTEKTERAFAFRDKDKVDG